MKISIFVIAAVSLLALAGCSSSGNGGNAACSNTTPCGGNPVGSWKLTAGCLKTTSSLSETCGPVSDQITETFASGTLIVNADLSYTSSVTVSQTESGTVASSCLASAGASDCNGLAQAGQTANPGSTWSCSNVSGGCSCTSTSPSTSSDDTGTFTISGNYATATSTTTSTITQYSFCVSANGGQLTMTPTAGAGASTGSETGSLVFTKQ